MKILNKILVVSIISIYIFLMINKVYANHYTSDSAYNSASFPESFKFNYDNGNGNPDDGFKNSTTNSFTMYCAHKGGRLWSSWGTITFSKYKDPVKLKPLLAAWLWVLEQSGNNQKHATKNSARKNSLL